MPQIEAAFWVVLICCEGSDRGYRYLLPDTQGYRWPIDKTPGDNHMASRSLRAIFRIARFRWEGPGIHLHHSGQRDLLGVFEDLSDTNTVTYTTQLSSMVDPPREITLAPRVFAQV